MSSLGVGVRVKLVISNAVTGVKGTQFMTGLDVRSEGIPRVSYSF